jgi:NAD(P)H dehydrogenase (quinone)
MKIIVTGSTGNISKPLTKRLVDQGHTTIRYIGSEETTCNEAAKIIGTAVGKPWLKWVLLSEKQMLQGLKMAKLPEKLAEFAKEFAAVYKQE